MNEIITKALKEAGFEKDELINFGLIEKDKKVQQILFCLKDYSRLEIYNFVATELDIWKERKIEGRINRKLVYKKLSQTNQTNPNSAAYFLLSNAEIEKRYENSIHHDLIKIMNWVDNNILNKK